MKRMYYWVRCKLGKPITYKKYPYNTTDWYYAICRSCDRQSGMHKR